MFALILVTLSQIADTGQLLDTMDKYLKLIAPPGQAEVLIAQITVLLENWKLVGAVGLLGLMFFSSLALPFWKMQCP